ncbi:hypothetical protein ACFP1Z_22420 [Streptomyces gamaensis]|uniref:Methyltransferase type 12 n=1 Tax=Streptomyces gamaensis TaxID=1763542 RepID=A0ABW0Z941_9ACTN
MTHPPAGPGREPGTTRFDAIYDCPDPRPYFTALRPLEYRTPHHAQGLFRRLAARLRTLDGRPPVVLDVCCSYGVNAALINHEVTLDELYERYTGPATAALSSAELVAADRRWFADRRRPDAVPVTGLDVAARAVAYARAAGLLDAAFAENLETGAPGPGLLRAARRARLITVTGGTSFLTARTLAALVAAAGEPPWVAAFWLRTLPYEPIARALAAHGLRTETVAARTYPQRRFTDAEERDWALAAVAAAGADPRGRESEGYYHAALHVSRPARDVAAVPLAELLEDGSG